MIGFAEHPDSTNLKRLLRVRSVLYVVLTAAIGVAATLADLALPLGPIAAIIAALAAATLFSRQRVAAAKPLHRLELPFQLGVDVASLTGLLYFTGGWTNPLVSLYLVPIAAASAMLPARLAWAIAVAAVLSYAVVAQFYRPLVLANGSTTGTFAQHVMGMWLTFVIAAGLIAYFGTTMAATLRRRAQSLASAREANLRNEQIIGVATLAAGTAHELSTPLNSIAVIANDLRVDAPPHQRHDLDVIIGQIDACKDILRRLRDAAAVTQDDRVLSVDAFIDGVRDRFQLLRPTVNVEFNFEGDPLKRIAADQTLRQAVLNLLNNAADVSPDAVVCAARCTASHLVLDILDRGAGFDVAARAAEPTDSLDSRSANGATEGMGMGLLLANATIERLGGSVHITDRNGGGARVQVTLPLDARTMVES